MAATLAQPVVARELTFFCSSPSIKPVTNGSSKLTCKPALSSRYGLQKVSEGAFKCRHVPLREPSVESKFNLRRQKPTVVMSLNDGTYNEDDPAYSVASIVEAAEVRSGGDGFVVNMNDGRHLACTHHSQQNGPMPDSGPQSAMVLKLEDGSDIMLPIIVLEQPVQILMEALKNIPLTRPTVYQVMKDMIGFMGYEVKMVRITHRVCEAYFARTYLKKIGGGDSDTIVSIDMRPSDAVNLAVRAKVPIQVNKILAQGDGVVPLSVQTKLSSGKFVRHAFKITEDDRPENLPCIAAEEFSLVRSITVAAMLERYSEAAKLRDELNKFRAMPIAGKTQSPEPQSLQEHDQL